MRLHARTGMLGYLERTSIQDGALVFEGWASSEDRPVDTFRVTCAGRAFDEVRVVDGLPSPDVAAALPGLARADRCRYRVSVPLAEGDRERARTAIVGLTPIVGDREGYLMLDALEPILPRPPFEHMAFVGDTAYHRPSFQTLSHAVQWAGLRPVDDVLDAGCGVGRMAYPLVHYLAPTARYEGFDVAPGPIRWAQENITPRFPNFQFRSVDLYNKLYNPGGTGRPADFRFPYEDQSFDFVLSISLFTHLLAADARHYLAECQRVLRPGGRCFHTFFLINRESRALIRAGKSKLDLVHRRHGGFTNNPEVPEDAIGFKERSLLRWAAARGFAIRGKHYGSWPGRPGQVFYHDVLVLEKRPPRRLFHLFSGAAGRA